MALEVLRQVVQDNPDAARLRLFYAQQLTLDGQYGEAQRQYQIILTGQAPQDVYKEASRGIEALNTGEATR